MNSSFNNRNLVSTQEISWDLWLPDTHMYNEDKFLCHCCSVTKYCSTLWQHGLLCSSLCLVLCSNLCPLNQWCHLTIYLYFLLPPVLFPFNLSQHQDLFQWAGSSHQVDKVLELQPQHQFFQSVFRVDVL